MPSKRGINLIFSEKIGGYIMCFPHYYSENNLKKVNTV